MDQEKALEKLKKDVRSLLMSSKMGLDPEQLQRDYFTTIGCPMPLKLLGFRNVMDMVKEMPDIVTLHFRLDGSQCLKAQSDNSTRDIEELVAKQRTTKKDKMVKRGGHRNFSPRYHQLPPSLVLPRRGRVRPPLPAHLRAQIRILLSKGPLRLSDLESSYYHCFGYPLHVNHYGFYSTGELLEAAGDMVAVYQCRLGSVLTLKQHMLPRPQFVDSWATVTPLMNPRLLQANKPQIQRSTAEVIPPAESPVSVKWTPMTHPCPQKSVQKESTPVSSKPEMVDKNQEDEPLLNHKSQLFHKHVLKLEEELRQQIVENGVAGTISQELKDKLRKVVSQTAGGMSVHDLPTEYKRLFGEDLPLTQSGFTSVTELVDAMNDLFHLKLAVGDNGNDWIISDIDKQNEERESSSDGAEVKSYFFSCGKSSWERQLEDEHDDDDDDHDVTADDEMEKLQANNISNTNLLTSEKYGEWQLHCGPTLPLDAMLSQRLQPQRRHHVRELAEIVVEKVESPGQFCIRFSGTEEAQALGDMMLEMRQCYNSPKVSESYQLPEQFVRRGQVCCLSPRGIWFYRVVIHQILSPAEVEVYYVDFGDVTVVETTNLKFLKSCYSVLPAQAVPSSLAGIVPNSESWTAEATASFQSLCFERTLVGALVHYTGDVLQLYLCDTCTAEDVYIHKVLLSQGHGKACSLTATAALYAQVTPVSLYFGEGMVALPEVDLGKIFSLKSVDQSTEATLEDEDDGLPGLEFIEGIEVVLQTQGDGCNPFSALITENSLNNSELNWTSTCDSPVVTSTPSTMRCLVPPDLILTSSN